MPIIGTIASSYRSATVGDTGSMFPLSSIILASNQSSIEFTNIPQTFKHLQVRGIARSARSGLAQAGVRMQVNGDTGSNYAFHINYGTGTGTGSEGYPNEVAYYLGEMPAATANSLIFSPFVIDVLDYTNTNKFTTIKVMAGNDRNGAGQVTFASGLWRNTNAITSIRIFESASNMVANSSVALYGIK